MKINYFISIMLERGFSLLSELPTAYKIFTIDKNGPIYRVYAPIIDNHLNAISVSGFVGIVDMDYHLANKLLPISLQYLGRHMLSLSVEWQVDWRIDPTEKNISRRIDLVNLFLQDLPKDRDEIRESYITGEICRKNLIFDMRKFNNYLNFVLSV